MIARTWQTKTDPARVDEFEKVARTRSLPMFQEQYGCLGVLFAREASDAVSITLWEDRQALERLATSPSYQTTVHQIEATGFLEGEQVVSSHTVFGGFLNLGEVAKAL